MINEFPQSRCWAKVASGSSPALATRRWSSKTMRIRSGWLRGSIYRVFLFWGRFFIAKPLSQIQRSTLLPPQDAKLTPSIGGFGISGNELAPMVGCCKLVEIAVC